MSWAFLSATPKNLFEIAGNTVNNEALTFTGSNWKSSRPLYWDAGTYNIYAYCPRLNEIGSITDLVFEVATDQRESQLSGLDGYESSDFLFASAKEISASPNPVDLKFRHIMSKISIRLIKGEDYEGDIPEKADVYIHNTVTESSIDLMVGVATKGSARQSQVNNGAPDCADSLFRDYSTAAS